MKTLLKIVMMVAATISFSTASHSQDSWLSGTGNVRIIVPAPPGGVPDITARIIADHLSRKSKRTFIVENKPGASGGIAAQEVARAAPDGSTLLITTNSFFSVTPHFFKIAVNPQKDLTPLAETGRNSLVLLGNPKLEPKTFPELISYVKARPGEISIGSASAGTVFHVAALLLNDQAGLDMVHVPYKGSAQAQNDVMGNHIPLLFDALPGAAENIIAGNVRAFAVNGGAGQGDLLGIPAFKDLGFPDMDELAPWLLFAGPAGMPADLCQHIHDVISEAVRSEGYTQKMKQLRSSPPKTTSLEELNANLKSEIERISDYLKAKNIKPQ